MNDTLLNILNELEAIARHEGNRKMFKNLTKANRLRLLELSFGVFSCLTMSTLITIYPPVFWVNNPLPYITGFTILAMLGGGIGTIGVRKLLDRSNQDQADQ